MQFPSPDSFSRQSLRILSLPMPGHTRHGIACWRQKISSISADLTCLLIHALDSRDFCLSLQFAERIERVDGKDAATGSLSVSEVCGCLWARVTTYGTCSSSTRKYDFSGEIFSLIPFPDMQMLTPPSASLFPGEDRQSRAGKAATR